MSREYPFRMPITLILRLANEAAQVEITAFAAGAGPPANRIATHEIGAPTDFVSDMQCLNARGAELLLQLVNRADFKAVPRYGQWDKLHASVA